MTQSLFENCHAGSFIDQQDSFDTGVLGVVSIKSKNLDTGINFPRYSTYKQSLNYTPIILCKITFDEKSVIFNHPPHSLSSI